MSLKAPKFCLQWAGSVSHGCTVCCLRADARSCILSNSSQAKCSVRGIHLTCKQRFQGSRWGGSSSGRSPARIFFYFFPIFFRIFLLDFKEKKGDVLTNI